MENQRIRLSKKLLKDALLDLLAEKEITRIKVQEICGRAEINRTTFYKYYGSPQELLNEIEVEMFGELSSHMALERGPLLDILTQTIAYLVSDIRSWRVLVNATNDLDFVEKLFSCSSLQSELDEIMHLKGKYSPGQMRYVHVCLYSGCYAMLREWINQDDSRESPKEMAELLMSFVSRLF